MIFNWYLICNLSVFDTGLISKNFSLELEDIGLKEILLTKGNITSLIYEGVMVSPDLSLDETNFHYRDGIAVDVLDSGDVYLGIEVV